MYGNIEAKTLHFKVKFLVHKVKLLYNYTYSDLSTLLLMTYRTIVIVGHIHYRPALVKSKNIATESDLLNLSYPIE